MFYLFEFINAKYNELLALNESMSIWVDIFLGIVGYFIGSFFVAFILLLTINDRVTLVTLDSGKKALSSESQSLIDDCFTVYLCVYVPLAIYCPVCVVSALILMICTAVAIFLIAALFYRVWNKVRAVFNILFR